MESNTELDIPNEVTEAATLANQLHEQLFPTETPAEPGQHDEPAPEAPVAEQPAEDVTAEHRYKTLQGKYNKEVVSTLAENRQLRKDLETLQAAQNASKEAVAQITDTRLEDVLNKLKEEYPDELIENLRLLNRLEAEQITREAVRPMQESHASSEEQKQLERQNGFVEHISTSSPAWEKIWNTANDLFAGNDPEDPAIAEFLNSSDPSGLYTNLQLLDMYNEKFDAERFAKVCNLYETPKAPAANPSRDALLAPSRVTRQAAPVSTEAKNWSMRDIQQFQSDRRNDKYSDDQADAIWIDIQKALAENRITG